MSAAENLYGGGMAVTSFRRHHSATPLVTADRKLPRHAIRVDCRRWAARMISALFPGPSVEAVAQSAAGPLGVTPRTIRRILDGTTENVSGDVLTLLCTYCRWRGLDPMSFSGGKT